MFIELEELAEHTRASEGIDSNLYDMVNYAIFALIKLDEEKTTQP